MVDVRRPGVLDPVGERGDDRRRDRLVAVLEESAAIAASSSAAEHVPALDDAAELLAGELLAGRLAETLAEMSSRATAAQLWRETTCERIFASRPSDASG